MLILTAAAFTKERTRRLHPIGRSFQHRDQIGVRIILFIAPNTRPHPLARERKRHHNHPAIDPAHALTEIRQVIDP